MRPAALLGVGAGVAGVLGGGGAGGGAVRTTRTGGGVVGRLITTRVVTGACEGDVDRCVVTTRETLRLRLGF